MVFADAETIMIDNKEVKSIILQDGGILYKKNEASITFSFTGTGTFSLLGDDFGDNVVIYWGDGSKEKYIDGDMYVYENGNTYFYEDANQFMHHYEDGEETHTVQIFNVKEIGDFAFLSKQGIDNVFISSDVTEIGYGAFMQCPLTNITLSEGLTSIGPVCFSSSNLTKIIIPSTVTSLGKNCFAPGTINKICFLWDTAENIITYSTDPYQQLSTDYKFYIPEGTTQLYVNKGYPLAKLIEGSTSITLTSDKDTVDAGEIATIVATLDPPAENTTIIFTIGEEEEQTLVSIGSSFELSTLNGFDVTNLGNINLFSRADTQGRFIKILNLMGSTSIMAGKSASFNTYDIMYGYEKIHIDPNNIIVYEYTDSSRTQTKIVDVYSYFLDRNYISEIDLTEWDLMSGGSSDRMQGINNTGVYATTDSNGQAIMKYEGVGAGNVTITGTYMNKNISDDITITDTEVLHLTSDKESIEKNETAILTASLLPKKENEVICINKIISDENLNLELTSIDNGASHMIKAKVTDENDNGVKNINIKLFKEE